MATEEVICDAQEKLTPVNDEPQRLGLTKFDRKIIDGHEQIFPLSCIPSAAEMVLKLLGRVPESHYDLQLAWQNKCDFRRRQVLRVFWFEGHWRGGE